jgi:sugar lactone lactonase YvrE
VVFSSFWHRVAKGAGLPPFLAAPSAPRRAGNTGSRRRRSLCAGLVGVEALESRLLPASAVQISDSFNRADANLDNLGQADLFAGGSGAHFYVPLWGGGTSNPTGASIVSGVLQNNGMDFGGVEWTADPNAVADIGRGEDVGQDINLSADFLVPTDAGGHISEAGLFLRSRAAAPGDGLIGGQPVDPGGGYWIQLLSTGLVRVKDLRNNTIVASTSTPASFRTTIFHNLEIAAQGTNLQVALDGTLQTFDVNGSSTTTVPIPPTELPGDAGTGNAGTAGISFGAEGNRGLIGGQEAKNLILSTFSPLTPSPMALTAAGSAAGFSLSTFASGFPTIAGIGPLGITFTDTGGVMVSDFSGNVRVFPTDADGQSAAAAPIGGSYGFDNADGLDRIAPPNEDTPSQFFLAGINKVVQLNADGSLNQVIVPVPSLGLVVNPANDDLLVSSEPNLVDVDPAAKTSSNLTGGLGGQRPDGMAVSADGSVVYVSNNFSGHVLGFSTSTGAQVFDSGLVGAGVTEGIDGVTIGPGTLDRNLFVNTNAGDVFEINLDTLTQTLIASGGTRGDFLTVDPSNNTILLTQSTDILRLTLPAGTQPAPQLKLTAAGAAAGFSLSTFATGFPTATISTVTAGPIGIALTGSGGVMVSDFPGHVRVFPTDTDGQSAASAPVGGFYGFDNAFGLAGSGSTFYMTQNPAGHVVQLNADGSFNHNVVPVPSTGIVVDPVNGHLLITGQVNNTLGIADIDPVAQTSRAVVTGLNQDDGIAISPDGTTVYVTEHALGRVLGFSVASGAKVFDSGIIGAGPAEGVDGIVLGPGALNRNLIVNTNAGNVIAINLDTLTQTVIASGGSRGDFMVVDPNNGTLLLTQSDEILRLTLPGAGRGGNANQQFIRQIYLELLQRPVDSGALTTFSAALDQGALTRTQLVQEITASQEYRTLVVQNLYMRILHRSADPSGLSTFVTLLAQGGTAEQIEAQLLGSDEYFNNRGGGTTAGFLGALYQDVLNRPIDNTGLQVWELALANGTSRLDVAAAILASAESDADQVQSAYTQFLHRPADMAGLNGFVSFLQQGRSILQVITALVTSAEFAQGAGGDPNQLYVTQLYLDLLHRQPDSGGLAFFTQGLDAGTTTRDGVVQAILHSSEYEGDVVQGLYQQYLGRAADPAGLAAFTGMLRNGSTVEQVAALLAGSSEFFQNRGGGTNDGFLNALYQDALGRAVDPAGRAAWDAALAKGTTAGAVAAAILASSEYQQDVVQNLYQEFLRRPADPSGLAVFSNLLASGATDEAVIAALVESTEYFAL